MKGQTSNEQMHGRRITEYMNKHIICNLRMSLLFFALVSSCLALGPMGARFTVSSLTKHRLDYRMLMWGKMNQIINIL